jgi:drug/metabolite transporter (DMT)-like permease
MLLHLHSGLRNVVLILGVVVVAYAVYGVATKRAYDQRMRALSAAFTGAIDLTALVGLAHLFTSRFRPQLGGHIAMMVLAVAVAHVVAGVMKRRPPAERTYMPHVVGTLIVLAIVSFGILALGRPIVG